MRPVRTETLGFAGLVGLLVEGILGAVVAVAGLAVWRRLLERE